LLEVYNNGHNPTISPPPTTPKAVSILGMAQNNGPPTIHPQTQTGIDAKHETVAMSWTEAMDTDHEPSMSASTASTRGDEKGGISLETKEKESNSRIAKN
jgi:hypothetical protein